MVELRVDLLEGEVDVHGLVSATPLPAIVTNRSVSQGGRGSDDPVAREKFYARWAAAPAAFFDLEFPGDAGLVDRVIPRDRAILSWHSDTTPSRLEAEARAMLSRGTRLIKLVPRAGSLDDVLSVTTLAAALEPGGHEPNRTVVFAAGETGRATRLLSPLFGAPLAYTAWSCGRKAASGQYTPEELLALIGHLRGRPRRLFAVLGSPVSGSLSPRLHAAAFRELGLPHLFVPLEVASEEELDRLVRPSGETAFDRIGLAVGGYAVTMPWKEEAAARCSVLAPRARRARAANTILPKPGKVLGDTTDIDGVLGVLRDSGVELEGRAAVVLGTGGSSRAVAVGLDLAGAAVSVCGRDRGAAERLASELGLSSVAVEATSATDVLVNATPAGADGRATDWLNALQLAPGTVVVDLPYGSEPTGLELMAEDRGWTFFGGRDVLLFQGIAQFAAMNGMAPPVRAMAAALGLEETQG